MVERERTTKMESEPVKKMGVRKTRLISGRRMDSIAQRKREIKNIEKTRRWQILGIEKGTEEE